jgi:hypothetical protein
MPMHSTAEKFVAEKNVEHDRMTDSPINYQFVIPAQAGI